MPDGSEPGSFEVGPLEADLARLIADSREEDATRARIRERGLRAAATGDATLGGVLVDLAESSQTVWMRTTCGRTLHGEIGLVCTDAIGINTGQGSLSYVRLGAIALIRRSPGTRAHEPTGDRLPPRPTTLAALLGDLAPQRPRVGIAVPGEPALVTGELRASGADMLTVRMDGDPPATVYVPTAQLSVVTVLASG